MAGIPENLKYSKCPCCGKRGIDAYPKKSGFRFVRLKCKHCKETVRINGALYWFNFVLTLVVMFIIEMMITVSLVVVPWWVMLAAVLIALFLLDYFAPLKKAAPTEKKQKSRRH